MRPRKTLAPRRAARSNVLMMARRLAVRVHRDEALYLTRITIAATRLVYVFVCDKKLVYETGRSRIAYIGTTKNGVWRIASSAAHRAQSILGTRGVYTFLARIVSCTPKKGVKSWHKLERAMLLAFKEKYGVPPICNAKGNAMHETDEFTYFSRSRIARIVDDLS